MEPPSIISITSTCIPTHPAGLVQPLSDDFLSHSHHQSGSGLVRFSHAPSTLGVLCFCYIFISLPFLVLFTVFLVFFYSSVAVLSILNDYKSLFFDYRQESVFYLSLSPCMHVPSQSYTFASSWPCLAFLYTSCPSPHHLPCF